MATQTRRFKMSGNLRSTAGQVVDRKLAGLIEPVVAAAGMDLESVQIKVAGKRRRVIITLDSDQGVSHNDLDGVSRNISAMLDASNPLGDAPYTLEFSPPGVARPLTEPRHWRRARGRLVRAKVAGEGSVEGRVLAAGADGVTLGLAAGEGRVPFAAAGAGRRPGRVPWRGGCSRRTPTASRSAWRPASAGSATPTWARAASRWSSAGFRTPSSTTLVIRSVTTRCLTTTPTLELAAMDIDLSVRHSLESEKDISSETAIKAIEDALLMAYHKTDGATQAARVEGDRKAGHV